MLGKWVGSATIGNRLVGMGISGTANVGAQIYYGEEFSWATFGTSIITGGATVNMGYWGATTVNAAGSGIASVIDQKSPWHPMAASVVGSTIGYGLGKTEKPLDKFFNPAKNNMKWMQSSNTPIIYPYPKSNAPAIIAGSGSAVLLEMATHETEEYMRSNRVLE